MSEPRRGCVDKVCEVIFAVVLISCFSVGCYLLGFFVLAYVLHWLP